MHCRTRTVELARELAGGSLAGCRVGALGVAVLAAGLRLRGPAVKPGQGQEAGPGIRERPLHHPEGCGPPAGGCRARAAGRLKQPAGSGGALRYRRGGR